MEHESHQTLFKLQLQEQNEISDTMSCIQNMMIKELNGVDPETINDVNVEI